MLLRMSQLFVRTLRDDPADAEVPSHRLLVRAGYVRRVAPELPTKCGTVIVANDGRKFIKAEVDGIAHRAREAVLGANGWWYGAWRKAEGDGLLSAMFPEHISAPTWKVDDQ